jgi:hypothetical protein
MCTIGRPFDLNICPRLQLSQITASLGIALVHSTPPTRRSREGGTIVSDSKRGISFSMAGKGVRGVEPEALKLTWDLSRESAFGHRPEADGAIQL